MNFLSPWFLLGALAVAGPIVFHLIRRAIKERVPFSSLMFLRASPPKTTRRRRIEHFWLLALRCLCLGLLAAAFARPFLFKDSALPGSSGEGRQTILLVDTSASMQREGLWEKARETVERYLKKARPEDAVAVVVFDRQPATLVSFHEWTSWAPDQRAALAGQRLAAMTPGWMGTQLGFALTSAGELFVDDGVNSQAPARREIVLVSDLQEGAKLDGLQGHEWPRGLNVIVERVDTKAKVNAGLEIVGDAGKSASDGKARVRVTNARDSGREKFQLAWERQDLSAAAEAAEIYLPPGQTRIFAAPKLPDKTQAATLRLTGDEVEFDNRAYYAAPKAERVVVAWLGAESENEPAGLRYYFQRVFPVTQQRTVEVAALTGKTNMVPELLGRARLAVVPGGLSDEAVSAVRDWVRQGNAALVVVTNSAAGPMLAALCDAPEIQVTEAGGDYGLLGQIDFTHPLFAPFNDPRYSDFSRIHFWKHRRVQFPASARARVLAQFDDGSPALAQISVGEGNILVLTSGWNPQDSQMAVSSKFPPLMQTLLDWTGATLAARYQFTVGDAIPSPWGNAGRKLDGETPTLSVEWRSPEGETITLGGDKAYTDTKQPGIYTASWGGQERRFAANLPLDESRTTAMSPDELARLGVPMEANPEFTLAQAPERTRHLQEAEQENRQKLWRWVIAGVLAVMGGEIFVAGWLARRAKVEEVVA